jgi:hypothetical protein
MNNWCICWLFTHIFTGILIFKGLNARRLYKSFGVKELRYYNRDAFNSISSVTITASKLKHRGKIMYTARCQIYAARCQVYTAHYQVESAHLQIYSACCQVQASLAEYTLPVANYTLRVAKYTLHVAKYNFTLPITKYICFKLSSTRFTLPSIHFMRLALWQNTGSSFLWI